MPQQADVIHFLSSLVYAAHFCSSSCFFYVVWFFGTFRPHYTAKFSSLDCRLIHQISVCPPPTSACFKNYYICSMLFFRCLSVQLTTAIMHELGPLF